MQKSFNILVTTDYSESARNAERYAVLFAKATQSNLLFTHVFNPTLIGTSMSFDADKIDYDPVSYQYNRLSDHVSTLFDELGVHGEEVRYKCVVREGNNIRKQIEREVDESGIDLVIAGTHRASAIHEWLFGSHTWDLIKHTEVPLLAIPEQVTFSDIKRIVFATEYREGEIPAIHYLTRIAQSFNAEVSVLHIANDLFSKEFEVKLFDRFEKEVKSQVVYDKLSIRLVYKNNIIEGLNEYSSEQHVNWLVMSPERFSLMEKLANPADISITKQMSFHASVPLMVLPDFYNTTYADMMKMF